MRPRKVIPHGYVLGVDTSSDILGVGLLPRYAKTPTESSVTFVRRSESSEIATMEIDAGLHHVEQLVPTVEALLRRREVSTAELVGLVAAKGPGSFTGLRIGVSLLKGMSGVSGTPLALVPTLEAHALPYSGASELVCSALDARKDRFYVQFFRNGEYLTPALDLTPREAADRGISLLSRQEKVLLVGPDAGKLFDAFQEVGTDLQPELPGVYRRSAIRGLLIAGDYRLHRGDELPDDGGPLYLRGSEAVFPIKR